MNAKKLALGLILVALVATTGCGLFPTPTGEELVALSGYAARVSSEAAAAATATAEASTSGSVTPTVAVTMTASPTITATVTTPTLGVTTTITSTVTSTATLTSVATVTPTLGVESREERLERLTKIYKDEGVEAMLKAAGFTWVSLEIQARQIEEEVEIDKILASGVQVRVTDLTAPWPSGFTTDRKVVGGRAHQPDIRNASVIYTDVSGFTGPATLWLDLSDWGQLAPLTPAP